MGKGPRPKNKKPSEKWKKYKVQGNVLIRDKMCPKCTVFLAEHKDRLVCGKCGYTEFKKRV